MKCSKCYFDNPTNALYCNGCGHKLELACKFCGKANPPESRFCNGCGNALALPSVLFPKDLSFEEKIEKIRKYLPSDITKKILSQRDKIEGEKRQVTVMFCDMKGFTPFTSKLDPEEVYTMMDQVYEILIHRVHAYEGTVNEMTGDGVMALFGAPIALEDAPQRALRSAMSIHREIARYNEKVKRERSDLPPIQMRIGIHTGPVVVGTLGNDLRVEFKAVGDTVNLAARMESLAEPGTTYVTEDTFKLTEGYFRFEALGEKEIKGKEQSLKVYRVIDSSTRRTRFDVSAEKGLTPFVGRQRELELLLDSYERSKEGRGQAISIISEAGIGKSRLLYEFRKAVTNENVTFLEGRCLSYSRNIAYHPIVDVLRANFDIQDMDTDQVIREKVTRFLKALNIDEGTTLPYILELLSVKDSGIEKIQMSPEARKDRTLEALKRITLKGADYRHVIMAIEDLHWMDRSSEDALKELLESIPGARIFLIFTYRPEFIHTWGSRSYHSQVTLNKLSNRESLAMIEHVLASRVIDRNLEDLILQKSEGIPFFIEEFIKSLKDLKIIECRNGEVTLTQDIKSVSIPSTIQEVIMARIDKLPEEAREVLRTGSVIEREFSHELLKKVTGLPEQELLSHLSILKYSELLYERGIYPESTYIFKHALTREVVYDSILTIKKKHLHAMIASTIEDIYKKDIYYYHGVLSGHYISSENYEKGAEYARLEAKRYQKAALFKDAIEYAKRSIRCLEKLPLTESTQKKIIDARTTLANYYLNLSHNLEAKKAVEPIMDLAERLNYHKRLPGIYSAIGLYYLWSEENFAIGFPYIQKALKISEDVGDYLSLYMASILSGYYLHYECEFEKALLHFKKSLELSEKTNNKMGITASKAAMSQMHTFQGNIDLAFKAGKESLDIVKESGDIFFKGIGYSAYGCALYYKGMFSESEGYLLEGLDFCAKTSQAAWGSWTACHLGCMYFDIGDYIKAEQFLKKIISTFDNVNFLFSWSHMNKSGLTKTRIRNYNRDVDLNELLDNFNSVKIKVGKGWYARNVGDVLLNIDDDHLTDSEVWIKKAIDADTQYGTRWQLANDHALYADWFKKKGDIQGAKEELTKAIDIFKECGADGWVTRTQESLAKLA